MKRPKWDLNLVPSVLPPILKAQKALGRKQVTHSTNLAKHDVYNLQTRLSFFLMNCCELRNRDVIKEKFLPKVIIELLNFVGDSFGCLSSQGPEQSEWEMTVGRYTAVGLTKKIYNCKHSCYSKGHSGGHSILWQPKGHEWQKNDQITWEEHLKNRIWRTAVKHKCSVHVWETTYI